MATYHPFQALSTGRDGRIFAACGSEIISIAEDGSIAATWTSPPENTAKSAGDKRKLDDVGSKSPLVLSLSLTPDSQHLCVATEDKYIRVLEIGSDGGFVQLSQRCMPKRICAIEVSEDSNTIICGDKFGDCYSLPLLAAPDSRAEAANGKSEPKTYEPAASELTVHSQRNRKALEEQRRAKGRPTNSREPLAFEHKLLLGHVSMLTDMKLAKDRESGADYIITCDRDEHIRVSRGIPQTHIIEGFCMGHTEFVHKLVLIPGTTTLLSAGGDDWMGVWDWKTRSLLAKHDLSQLRPTTNGAGDEEPRVAVENIWLIPRRDSKGFIAVKAEGSTALALFDVEHLVNTEQKAKTVDAAEIGNIIEMLVLDDRTLVVSVDGPTRLHALQLEFVEGKWKLVKDEERSKMLTKANEWSIPRPHKLDQVLHSAERLRKLATEDNDA